MARKRRRRSVVHSPSSHDIAEVAAGRGSARDRAEVGAARKKKSRKKRKRRRRR